MPGPVPKRSNQRRRRNLDSKVTPVAGMPTGCPKPADKSWLPSIQAIWTSLGDSGQSVFYEASDWAEAWLVCETLDIAYTTPGNQTGQLSAALITTALNMLGNFGTTEADRRRLKMELIKPDADGAEDAVVVQMNEYKQRLGVA